MSKQNLIRRHAASKIRDFSDRLLASAERTRNGLSQPRCEFSKVLNSSGEQGQRLFAAAPERIEPLRLGGATGALETGARLSWPPAQPPELTAVEVDSGEGHALGVKLRMRGGRLDERARPAGAPQPRRHEGRQVSEDDPKWRPLASVQDPDVDFREQKAEKSGGRPVAGRLARSDRLLDDAHTFGNAPGLD